MKPHSINCSIFVLFVLLFHTFAFSVEGGNITGVVVDEITGEPLPGIDVHIRSKTFGVSIQTDANGMYSSFAPLKEDTYLFYIEIYQSEERNYSYISKVYENLVCLWNCRISNNIGTQISVGVDEIVQDINFSLIRGGKIEGHVSDKLSGEFLPDTKLFVYDEISGNPISFMDVVVYSENNEYIGQGWSGINGEYRINVGLQQGRYFIFTRAYSPVTGKYLNETANGEVCSSNECRELSNNLIDISLLSGEVSIDFYLEEGFEISGTVFSESDKDPIEGVWLHFYNEKGDLVSQALTDINGKYVSREPLAEGGYVVFTSNTFGLINKVS